MQLPFNLEEINLENVTPFRGELADLPEKVKECEKSIREDNPDLTKSEAIAICRDQLNMSAPRVMAGAESLDSEPIEREELDGNKVAYRNIKLVDTGVWTDSASKTPTLYNGETFENTEPEWGREYDGPPANISHDLDRDGEPNEASIGGHIDPDSVRTDGDALFGDIILDRDTDAGAYADTNLQSALESQGEVGFSPSVELQPTEMGETELMRADEHVKAAELTGVGLVRDPASKSVDFAQETRNRAVAMASSGEDSIILQQSSTGMDEERLAELREQFNLSADVSDDVLMELVEAGALSLEEDDDDEEEEEEGDEMEEDGEGEETEEEEEEEEPEMSTEEVHGELQDLQARVDAIESTIEEAANQSALEDAQETLKSELADADTVEEIEARLSSLEDQPKDPNTLSDGDETDADGDFDWSDPNDQQASYDRSTGTTSY